MQSCARSVPFLLPFLRLGAVRKAPATSIVPMIIQLTVELELGKNAAFEPSGACLSCFDRS